MELLFSAERRIKHTADNCGRRIGRTFHYMGLPPVEYVQIVA